MIAGWHIHLDHLDDSLDGNPVDWSRWNEDQRPVWQKHHGRYAERLEAEL